MLLGFAGKTSAQFLPDVPDMKGKFTIGGDFDFGMYGNYLNFGIAPQVGYRIFSPWEVGLRGIYNLQCSFSAYYGIVRYNHETRGGEWFNSIFVGGGYRSYSYSGSYYYLMVLYNLSWGGPETWNNGLYPYSSPIVMRVGFCF